MKDKCGSCEHISSYHKLTVCLFTDCNWTRTQNHLVRNEHWPVWPNGWVFVNNGLSGSGCSCSHLNFRFRACFEQGRKIDGRFHSETRKWHDKNIQCLFTFVSYANSFLFLCMSWLYRMAAKKLMNVHEVLENLDVSSESVTYRTMRISSQWFLFLLIFFYLFLLHLFALIKFYILIIYLLIYNCF